MTDDTEDTTGRGRADAASPAATDRLARRYVEEDRPFARVTVVRREPPVSARVGDRAIVTADGELTGWIGGIACAQSVAVREAQAALRQGEPKLVGVAPDPATIDRPGLAAFPMTCHSQGTLELFVEPVLPLQRLVVVGDSPVTRALVAFADRLSADVTVVAPEDADVTGADRTVAVADDVAALGAEFDGATWLVVASMGGVDESAVEAGLAAGVPYVGLVASRRRADELCERVAERTGQPVETVRDRVTSPAGVDIGARTPEEIGVSILAELVATRRAAAVEPTDGARGTHNDGDDEADETDADDETTSHSGSEPETGDSDTDPGTDAETMTTAVDPVCGMDVTVGEAAATATHDGRTYHFCGADCRDTFVDNPDRFLERVEP